MKENTAKITKELCQNNVLLFYPQTTDEAEFIQRKIFDLGFAWSYGSKVDNLDECVSGGMVLDHGTLYYSPDNVSKEKGLLCTSSQLDENYIAPPTLEQQVKALAEEVTVLHATIDAIYEAIAPKTLDKPPVLSAKQSAKPKPSL